MARGRKRGAVTATMEEQIQKAQEKVIKTKTAYDATSGQEGCAAKG